jgi:hypothetical protein
MYVTTCSVTFQLRPQTVLIFNNKMKLRQTKCPNPKPCEKEILFLREEIVIFEHKQRIGIPVNSEVDL